MFKTLAPKKIQKLVDFHIFSVIGGMRGGGYLAIKRQKFLSQLYM
jgi:hypothetical protein